MFSAPPKAARYVDDILERSMQLINSGIWQGIAVLQLKGWWNQFHTEEEKYFAARLLDNLIYRSEEQLNSTIVQLFTSVLPNYTRKNPSPVGAGKNWLERLQQKDSDPGIRLIVPVNLDDERVRSPEELARILMRRFRIHSKWLVKPENLQNCAEKGIETYIFLDDFVGTGTQFSKLVKTYHIQEFLNAHWCLLAALMRHKNSDKKLSLLTGLHICAVEELDESYSVFDKNCRVFHDGGNTPQDALQFYDEFITRRGLTPERYYKHGFGKLALCVATKISVPNNTLPLFWLNQPGVWKPLFNR